MISNKKVLVTGAGGFIGRALSERLIHDGNQVTMVDIKPFNEWTSVTGERAHANGRVRDLRNPANCLEVTKDIDIVFNLAAEIGGMAYITDHRGDLMHSNSLINLNMLEASRINNVGKFFFSSSACVYPWTLQEELNSRPLKELDAIPADCDSFYGWEKFYTEKLCEAYNLDYGLQTRIARFHSIYGPGCPYLGERGKAPASFCWKALSAPDGSEIEVWGDGDQQRTFLYIDDCVDGILKITDSNYTHPFNLGTERVVSIDTLADIAIGLSGKSLTKKHIPTRFRGVNCRSADITLATTKLDWKPKVGIDEGMEKTYSWIRDL